MKPCMKFPLFIGVVFLEVMFIWVLGLGSAYLEYAGPSWLLRDDGGLVGHVIVPVFVTGFLSVVASIVACVCIAEQ